MSVLTELQRVKFERLKNSLNVSIYDFVPRDADFPFISLGEDNLITHATKDDHPFSLFEVSSTIHVFSRYKGMKEIKDIADDVKNAIIRTPLKLPNPYRLLFTIFDSILFMREDERTRHAILRFRHFVEEVSS